MIFTSFRKSAIICVAAQHHLLTIKGKNMGVRKRRQEKTGHRKEVRKKRRRRLGQACLADAARGLSSSPLHHGLEELRLVFSLLLQSPLPSRPLQCVSSPSNSKREGRQNSLVELGSQT